MNDYSAHRGRDKLSNMECIVQNPYGTVLPPKKQMVIGTPVTAARGGIVALVKNNSEKGGPDPMYRNNDNYVLIYHDDGNFGNYKHFTKNGIVVKAGGQYKPDF